MINRETENLYQLLDVIIREFESAATEGGTQEGLLAIMNGPLEAMIGLAESSIESIEGLQEDYTSFKSSSKFEKLKDTLKNELHFDEDLLEYIGGSSGSDSVIADYIAKCNTCRLRVSGKFQINIFPILGSLEASLEKLEANLEAILALLKDLDEFGFYKNICKVLDILEAEVCIPDMILLMLSLRALFKKYSKAFLDIKLDWTTLVGPLLLSIVRGVETMVNSAVQVSLTPLKCSSLTLQAVNESYQAYQELEEAITKLDKKKKEESRPDKTNGRPALPEEDWRGVPESLVTPPASPESSTMPPVGREAMASLDSIDGIEEPAAKREPKQRKKITSEITFDKAFMNNDFMKFSPLEKIIVGANDAASWVEDIHSKIEKALASVTALVSKGSGGGVNSLVLLSYILEMIRFLAIAIKLIFSKKEAKSWCNILTEDSSPLRDAMEEMYGRGNLPWESTPSADRRSIIINEGIVVPLCGSETNDQSAEQWLKYLRSL